jgi:hypothetical protein
MHGKQDGMGDGPCKGGDTKVPDVLDLNEACCPLHRGKMLKIINHIDLDEHLYYPWLFQ